MTIINHILPAAGLGSSDLDDRASEVSKWRPATPKESAARNALSEVSQLKNEFQLALIGDAPLCTGFAADDRVGEQSPPRRQLLILPGVEKLDRITRDPDVMGGKPCIRGLRVTVGTTVGLLAAGHTHEQVLQAYPYLQPDDIRQALAYAAWRLEEQEVPVDST